jgi:proline iminopeptidase
MRELYGEIEPKNMGYLEVDGHEIYFEESGNLEGLPVLFLHGGPGAGTNAKHRRFFDPSKYRIILMDQRGCGKSRPFASLEKNTTWDLVKDIERLREKLGVEKWVVFGGSWGSTLSLIYAISHPERVKALVVRGIFLARKEEVSWFYGGGAGNLFPEEWERFRDFIPKDERNDLLHAYHKRLMSNDRKDAAYAWSRWEGMTVRLETDPEFLNYFTEANHADAVARIEAHYFVNGAFLPLDNWILENAYKLKNIPTTIIHGRYDVICPAKSAWDLFKVMPHAKLIMVPAAGHSASDVGMQDALLDATDSYANI